MDCLLCNVEMSKKTYMDKPFNFCEKCEGWNGVGKPMRDYKGAESGTSMMTQAVSQAILRAL